MVWKARPIDGRVTHSTLSMSRDTASSLVRRPSLNVVEKHQLPRRSVRQTRTILLLTILQLDWAS